MQALSGTIRMNTPSTPNREITPIMGRIRGLVGVVTGRSGIITRPISMISC
jgi:hypothetical protein